MNNFFKEVLFIIVLYNQKLENTQAFTSLQVAFNNDFWQKPISLLVYDNSSQPLKKIESNEINIEIYYKYDANNGGVSKAYNFGAELAKYYQKKWLIFFDQDTSFSPSLMNAYVNGINKYPKIGIYAPILKLHNDILFSPSRLFLNKTHPPRNLPKNLCSLKKLIPLNSALCISVSLFEQIGGYNNEIPLDFSDVDFFRRMAIKQNEFICLNDAFCEHGTSDKDDIQINKIINRYVYFCIGAKNTLRVNFWDSFIFFCIAFIRCVNLSIRNRSLSFIPVFIKYYIVN